MTTVEAAAALGKPERTVRWACAKGRIPGAHRIGRDWHVPSAAVATIAARTASTGAPA